MTEATNVTWLVGRIDEVGQLDERLSSVDATIEETWTVAENAGVVALVRSGPDDADATADALGVDAQRFGGEDQARSFALSLADSA